MNHWNSHLESLFSKSFDAIMFMIIVSVFLVPNVKHKSTFPYHFSCVFNSPFKFVATAIKSIALKRCTCTQHDGFNSYPFSFLLLLLLFVACQYALVSIVLMSMPFYFTLAVYIIGSIEKTINIITTKYVKKDGEPVLYMVGVYVNWIVHMSFSFASKLYWERWSWIKIEWKRIFKKTNNEMSYGDIVSSEQ